ncbi:MAG: cytochrome c, class [Gammaproteobacteria bacterium]|nr:cytochrome c, class [Gammaproteobacteria bacterium]
MTYSVIAALGVSALAAALSGWSPARAEGAGRPAIAAKPPAIAGPDFPRPPGDPAAIARGKQTFSVNCGFCHGSSARGGEGGPNLLRSPIVLNDQNGELVAAIVSNGRTDKGMPRFNLEVDSIFDIAAYLHSIEVGTNASANFNPKSALVGNAAAGKAYFNGKGHCTACHSIGKDLAGVGSKYDPPHLQDMIFTAGGTGLFGEPSPTAAPPSVRVEMPSGELINGRLIEIDDFVVVLINDGGNRRTIRRDGDIPRIHVDNPLQAHLDLVRSWEDRDLHDLTAYLATFK